MNREFTVLNRDSESNSILKITAQQLRVIETGLVVPNYNVGIVSTKQLT